MAKSPKVGKPSKVNEKRFRQKLIAISISALIIKIFIIFRIQGFDWYQAGGGNLGFGLGELLDNRNIPPNAWLGADGENYLRGLQGLVDEGFYSEAGILSYWPAGYPLLMWPVIEIFRSHFFLALSLLQSLIYTAGSIWFVDEISRTRASKASYLLAWFLAFNPTLSLNTIAIGYELPVVAMLLISTAALLRYFSKNKTGLFSVETLVASAAFSLATLMQPRLLVIAFAFFVLWSLAKYKLAMIAPFLALTMGIVSLAPVLMVYRNSEVHGYTAISTNLGVTMRLGAGPTAPGGYSNTGSGSVECPETSGNAAEIDRALVNCVIKWYLNNPLRSVELFWNKARYFWSPWFGPEVNGTMARSPWNLNHPLRSAAQTEEGFNFIFGPVGKFVSWLWMLLSLAFLVKGFLYLWRFGDLERLIGLSAGLVFFVNLVSSMLTIGDNRFRIPTMGLSLFLQAVGLASLYANQRLKNERAEPVVAWPMLKSPNSNKDES